MRYFFDTTGADGARHDPVGVECASNAIARRLARRALGEMFSDSKGDGDESFTISVRDADGRSVFDAHLAYRASLSG